MDFEFWKLLSLIKMRQYNCELKCCCLITATTPHNDTLRMQSKESYQKRTTHSFLDLLFLCFEFVLKLINEIVRSLGVLLVFINLKSFVAFIFLHVDTNDMTFLRNMLLQNSHCWTRKASRSKA